MRKLMYILCLAILGGSLLGSNLLLGGCTWMGETAGSAQASVENGIDNLQNGYHDGYNETKGAE